MGVDRTNEWRLQHRLKQMRWVCPIKKKMFNTNRELLKRINTNKTFGLCNGLLTKRLLKWFTNLLRFCKEADICFIPRTDANDVVKERNLVAHQNHRSSVQIIEINVGSAAAIGITANVKRI